ncbi:MAG: WD40 repeat domain-containing protein, partial [Planctomycetota bacterium]|nr:WD40 repeat domain-containing protein [Planctomycetota bacterium]
MGGSTTGVIKLWNQADGADRLSLLGHTGAVQDVALRADGKQIASAGADGTVRVWSLPQAPRAIPGHTMPITRVAVSPNGALLATASVDGTVRLSTLADGKFVRALAGHKGAVHDVAFSSDGLHMATAGADGTVRLFVVATGLAKAVFEHGGVVGAVAVVGTGTQVISGGADKLIKQWDLLAKPNEETKKIEPIRSIMGHTAAVTRLAVVGPSIVSGSTDATVRVWTAATGAAVGSIPRASPVTDIAVSANGATLAVAAADKNVKLFTLATGAAGATLTGAPATTGVSFSADGTKVAAASSDGVWVWDAAGTLLERASTGMLAMRDARFVGNSTIVTGGADNSARVFTTSLVRLIPGHVGSVNGVAYTPGAGTQLVSCGTDKTVRLWNLADGAAVRSFAGAADVVSSVVVSADGATVVAASADKSVHTWTLATAAAGPKFVHPTAVTDVSLSADGKRIASSDGNSVRLWDVAGGQELERFEGHTAAVSSVALTGDGKSLVSGAADMTGRVWTSAAVGLVAAHAGKINELRVVPAGAATHVLTCGEDKTVKLWDVDGKPVKAFVGSAVAVNSVTLSADGSKVFGGTADNKVLAWTLADAKLVQTITTPGVVTDLELNAENSRLAVTGADKHVRVYSPAGVLLEDVTLVAAAVDLAFQPDGRSLAVAVGNNAELHTLSLDRLIAGHEGAVTGIAFSPDGTRLLSGGADKSVRLWNVADGKQLLTCAGMTGAVADVALSADGLNAIAGDALNFVRLWKLPAAGVAAPAAPIVAAATLTGPVPVTAVDVSTDGGRVTRTGTDGVVRV